MFPSRVYWQADNTNLTLIWIAKHKIHKNSEFFFSKSGKQSDAGGVNVMFLDLHIISWFAFLMKMLFYIFVK